jgi:hypothetical protein
MSKSTATLSASDRLLEIQSLLPDLERKAEAELDSICATGDGGMWSGSCKQRDELQSEARDLERIVRAEKRQAIESEMRQLDKALSLAASQRTSADHSVKTWLEHPTVQKWLNAPKVARDRGVGYSFEMCRSWIISGQSRAFAPQAAVCLNDPNWPQELNFLPAERDAIRAFEQAKGSAERALLLWQNIVERRAHLLNSNPEFKKAG